MKDLFKKATRHLPSTAAGNRSVAGPGAVQDFLRKVQTLPKTGGNGQARLVFALDATASRQATWDRASRLQSEMFLSAQATGGLQVQLCYFRGLGEFFRSDWHTNPDQLLRQMTGLSCQAGITQLERLLRHAIDETRRHRLRGVIFIGDAMEESSDVLCQLAGELGLLGVPLFMFQERQDEPARHAFEQMARLSGGAYCQFDGSSASQLRDLLKAVALYATGGLAALEDFSQTSHRSVRLLTRQLK